MREGQVCIRSLFSPIDVSATPLKWLVDFQTPVVQGSANEDVKDDRHGRERNLEITTMLARREEEQEDGVEDNHSFFGLNDSADDEVAVEWFGWGSP